MLFNYFIKKNSSAAFNLGLGFSAVFNLGLGCFQSWFLGCFQSRSRLFSISVSALFHLGFSAVFNLGLGSFQGATKEIHGT